MYFESFLQMHQIWFAHLFNSHGDQRQWRTGIA